MSGGGVAEPPEGAPSERTGAAVPDPTAPDPELVALARSVVGNTMGTDLVQKATDRFLAAAYTALEPPAVRAATTWAAESVLGPSHPTSMPAVLEFDGARPDRGSAAFESAGRTDRQARIEAFRTQAYVSMAPVYNEIERLVGGPFRSDPLTIGGRDPTSALATQICWLNGSLRTRSDPRALFDVAADPSVARIDLPRPLEPEAGPDLAVLGITETWRAGGDGRRADDVIVAVIDGEIALGHPALAGRVVHRQNFTNETWSNPGAHGTAVAGLLAADDPSYQGVAPGAVLYDYKVLATNSALTGDDFDGAIALQRAVEDGALVANCSWGAGPATDGTSREARAVDAAWALGVVVVKSAGNRGPAPSSMTTPADADGVVVVGATDLSGTSVATDSSRGPINGRPGPTLVAPGGTPGGHLPLLLPGGGFGTADHGTSYAAALVSGLAALCLAESPDLEPNEVRDRLVGAARSIPGIGVDAQGAGLAHVS